MKHVTIAISILLLVAFLAQGEVAWAAADSAPYPESSGAALTYAPCGTGNYILVVR